MSKTGTCVFSVRDGAWQAIVDGEIIKATFNSKGAAQAGIEVERQRRKKRLDRGREIK